MVEDDDNDESELDEKNEEDTQLGVDDEVSPADEAHTFVMDKPSEQQSGRLGCNFFPKSESFDYCTETLKPEQFIAQCESIGGHGGHVLISVGGGLGGHVPATRATSR